MAEKRARLYIDGNTVRKEQYESERIKEGRQAARHRLRKNRDRALRMSLPFLLMLAAASIAVVAICVSYLQVQSSITTHQKKIVRLEESLQTMVADNNALESSIDAYVNLDYIFKVATQELKMVYASNEQVIHYDKTESEYVRQYADIPIG